MITIGLRASPTEITFAIFDARAKRIINVEEIKIPAAFTMPEALKYVRSNLLDVLREYAVEQAGIRATEPTAQNPSTERIQIEGVIQEAFASSNLVNYYVGLIASISSKIGIDRSEFKPLVEGKDYPVEGWKSLTRAGREAVLTAIGAANV